MYCFYERCGDRQIRKPYKKSFEELFYIGFLMQLGESKKQYILGTELIEKILQKVNKYDITKKNKHEVK
jgi:hypothetical protein